MNNNNKNKNIIIVYSIQFITNKNIFIFQFFFKFIRIFFLHFPSVIVIDTLLYRSIIIFTNSRNGVYVIGFSNIPRNVPPKKDLTPLSNYSLFFHPCYQSLSKNILIIFDFV